MSLIVKQFISACLPSLQTPLESKHDSPHLKALSETSTKKASSPSPHLLLPAGVSQEQCSATQGDVKVLTTHSQLSLEVHRALQKWGENVCKFPEEENDWVVEENSTTEDCHTKYSSIDLCLHFLFAASFSLCKSSVIFATRCCSQSKYYNSSQEVWMMLDK